MRIRHTISHAIAMILPLLWLAAQAQAAPTKPATTRPAAANQFAAEADAKAHCPAGSVVWVNKPSKAIHPAGTKYYGKTKSGAYMCRQDADAAGFHLPRARTAATRPAGQGGTSQGGTSQGGTSQGGTSHGGTSHGGTSHGGTSQGETSQGETSQGETGGGKASTGR